MLPLTPFPAISDSEPLSIGAGRRLLAISLAVLIPALLLLLLLTFGAVKLPEESKARVSVVSLEASEVAADTAEPDSPAQKQAEKSPAEQPAPAAAPAAPLPPPPVAEPNAAPTMPAPAERPLPPAVPRPAIRPPGPVYGPPDTGGSPAYRDTERVGTAPNGEPLYAAAWYREPSDDELRGYLSTASGPGWGLIACRTAPNYRVEDCVGLDEYPSGSQINRAVLAAAWQFKVRPPRRGGQTLVGSWVRIRIDYAMGGR